MAKKKSKAQIKRMQMRAAARGEEYNYQPPEEDKETTEGKSELSNDVADNDVEKRGPTDKLNAAAMKLYKELMTIQENKELKSKDRRSATRKAEAIAAEEAGMSTAAEFRHWYDANFDAESAGKSIDGGTDSISNNTNNENTSKLQRIACKLESELQSIKDDESIKAKERRSAIRKAEAIAAEEADMPASELLDWYQDYLKSNPSAQNKGDKDSQIRMYEERRRNPYIAFFGQLSYETTRETLLEHIKKTLEDFKVKDDSLKIRILTDSKTKMSRGMAFVETDDPELLYGLLRLHKTLLDGRRINVERSAGGRNNERRKAKIAQYRNEQNEYVADVVDKMLSEYKSTGELGEEELDDGVISLCKRHAAPVVEAALFKYIESSGRDMDNPSAYLSFLIGKIATEGIYKDENGNSTVKRKIIPADADYSKRTKM